MASQAEEVKQAMRERYDQLGAGVVRRLDELADPAQVWHHIEGATPALAYFRRRKIQTTLELGRLKPRSSILDVGCGTGDYTLLLARLGFRMTGADLSAKSLEAARQKAARVGIADARFVISDAEKLEECPEAAFDAVVSYSTLRYVTRLDRAFQAIARILKPGGIAVLDFPNKYCPWFAILKRPFGVETHFHDHLYSAGEIARQFEVARFRSVRVKHVLFTSYLTPAPLLPLFQFADVVGERTPLVSHTAAIIFGRGVKV